MYYYSMSHEEILSHSRPFINALYKQYIQRACENLGISPKDNPDELSEDDYPDNFGKLPGNRRREPTMTIDETKEFMAEFATMGMGKYNEDKIIFDE